MKYSKVDCWRPIETKETAGITGDLEYGEVDCKRPVKTKKMTGDCRD